MRGRDVGRFAAATEGWYQLVPNRHYADVEDEETFADRYPLTYSYLKNYEGILRERSTYKRYQRHLPFYVIYCVGPYSFAAYKVVWPEQQDPTTFRASVVSEQRNSLVPNPVIVPDHKLYFADFDAPEESALPLRSPQLSPGSDLARRVSPRKTDRHDDIRVYECSPFRPCRCRMFGHRGDFEGFARRA